MLTEQGGRNLHDRKHMTLVGLWVMCLLLASLLQMLATPAWAQTTPHLAVSPASSRLYLNGVNTIVLELVMTDAMDLQSIDIIVTYDPAVLRLDGYQKGSFLDPFSRFYVNQAEGYLMLAYAKTGAPAVSGSGVILEVTFSGLSEGMSSVDVSQSVYAKPTGIKVYPTIENGSLTVGYIAHEVVGTVRMQGRSVSSGVEMTMTSVSHPEYGAVTGVSDDRISFNIGFEQLKTAGYRVTTHHPRYLNVDASLEKYILVAEDITLPPLNLICGNADWSDNVININDLTLVTGSFGKTEADLQPGEVLDGDVNFDGKVDMRDLALVAGNYQRTAADAYAGWLP